MMALQQELKIRIAAVSAADHNAALPFPSTLVEISCPAPNPTALAIILDMSDSCGQMLDEADKVPRLLKTLPREWEVWIYRLSERSALGRSGRQTVAHLQDSSLKLADWLGSREHRAKAEGRGSLILPVLEGIESQRKECQVERVVALAMTDGELLDSAAIPFSAAIHLSGVSKSVSPQARMQWRRVLGDVPLFSLSDSAVDDWMRSHSSSFFGPTKVSWQRLSDEQLQVGHFNPKRRDVRSLSEQALDWNFKDGPLFLLLHAPADHLESVSLSCSSSRTGELTALKLSKANAIIPPKLLSMLRDILAAPSSVKLNAILDHASSAPDFHDTARCMARAAEMAEQRRKWNGIEGILSSLEPSRLRSSLVNVNGDLLWDAVLCLCRVDVSGQAREYSRVVILGLNRQDRPALQWHAKQALPFGMPGIGVHIEYDPRESRWMISFDDGQRQEFDPRGSQVLARQLMDGDGTQWSAFFSGDLKS